MMWKAVHSLTSSSVESIDWATQFALISKLRLEAAVIANLVNYESDAVTQPDRRLELNNYAQPGRNVAAV
jgi:hypothetical protein